VPAAEEGSTGDGLGRVESKGWDETNATIRSFSFFLLKTTLLLSTVFQGPRPDVTCASVVSGFDESGKGRRVAVS
jgi:hypothetical protein